MKTICVAITGASGTAYGMRLVEQLVAADVIVYLLLSRAAIVVFKQELDVIVPERPEDQQSFFCKRFACSSDRLRVFAREDWFAPVASGSAPLDAMVICPCSGGTLSAIAHGASNNLIERAADVCLKERRQLILVPRETPYSQIHLENMLKMTQMGCTVLPASPGFYQKPTSIQDLVDFVVARILDQLRIKQVLLKNWGD